MKYKILILFVFLPFMLKSQSVLFSAKPIDFEENKRSFLDFDYDDFNLFYSVKFDMSFAHYYNDEYRFINTIFLFGNKEYTMGADISKRLGLSEYITAGLRWNISSNNLNYILPPYDNQIPNISYDFNNYIKTSVSLFLGNEYRLPKHKILIGAQLYYNYSQKLVRRSSTIYTFLEMENYTDEPKLTIKNPSYFNKIEASVEAYYLTRVFSIYAKYRLTDLMNDESYRYLEANRFTFGLCIFILR